MNTSRSPSYISSDVWSWHTHTVRSSTVPHSPYHMSSATELIHQVAAPLLLFPSVWTPDALGHLLPPPQLAVPQLICWIKHCREAHVATCDVRVSVRGHALVSKYKKGREEGGCIVPILCLHTEGYWVQTLESELQADRRGRKQHKKNKCRKSKHKGSNCTTWSVLCLYCLKCLFSQLYVL